MGNSAEWAESRRQVFFLYFISVLQLQLYRTGKSFLDCRVQSRVKGETIWTETWLRRVANVAPCLLNVSLFVAEPHSACRQTPSHPLAVCAHPYLRQETTWAPQRSGFCPSLIWDHSKGFWYWNETAHSLITVTIWSERARYFSARPIFGLESKKPSRGICDFLLVPKSRAVAPPYRSSREPHPFNHGEVIREISAMADWHGLSHRGRGQRVNG